MNSHEQVEIQFWRDLRNHHGSGYESYRIGELKDKTEHFPSFSKQKGKGLDLGCGLLSVLESSGKKIIAIDPLMNEYFAIFPHENRPVEYKHQPNPNEIPAEDGEFSWVFCVNVIDHTADPQALVKEIKRVLKKNGKLYFEVNFDDNLSPAHYKIWSKVDIDELFRDFTVTHEFVERVPEHCQTRYWAEMSPKYE